MTTGRIYLLGIPGSGKSTLCNYLARKGYQIFVPGGDPWPVTLKVDFAPSIIKEWDVYDSPGYNYTHKQFQQWWAKERKITYKYMVFIVISFVGGRFVDADIYK